MKGMAFNRRELAGAVADIGVLVPIAVALIVGNGLSPTAVLLPAGLLYVTAALVYRLPVPVQPLKAFGAIAIANGLGSDEIAAGALLMGVVFIALGRLGVLELASRGFPRALIRGVQLTVGLLFLEIAWKLLADPPTAFIAHALDPKVAVALGVLVVGLALALRQQSISLLLVGAGALAMVVLEADQLAFGPSALEVPTLDGTTFLTALTVLVVPQLPLSFANSCLATADAARAYFGDEARRVRPGRLATTFGSANLLAGSMGGMPVCHGAGGLTAHYAFGARTGGAPLVMGLGLLALALSLGAGLAPLLAAFPLPLLAGLLASAGLLHIGLLRDLRGAYDWALAIVVGAVGFQLNLTIALMIGLAAWWLLRAARALRERPAFGA
jgi:sulfate permease, SulP family